MRPARAAIAAASLGLAACATITTAAGRRLGLSSPEFRAYAETVFRRQNEVGTELGLAIDDRAATAGTEPAALDAAEDRLLAACAALNAMAAARRDDRPVTLSQRLESARSVPDCERATDAAAAALARR
jgi:hypothetical protein